MGRHYFLRGGLSVCDVYGCSVNPAYPSFGLTLKGNLHGFLAESAEIYETVLFKKVIEGWENRIKDFTQSFQADAYISITSSKGSLLEGNIKALIKDKFLLSEVDANNGFSLILSQKVIQMLQKERSQISVTIRIKPTRVTLDIGRMIEIGRVCQRERSSSDSGGHVKSLDRNGYFGGSGMSGGGGFEYRYDLDIHIFSY